MWRLQPLSYCFASIAVVSAEFKVLNKKEIMKKVFFIALLAFGMNVKAQITLEHTYNDSISIFSLVQFSKTDYKWAVIDTVTIKLYNVNHSLYKTIPIKNSPVYPQDVLFISNALFDTDSTNIEYMVDYSSSYYPTGKGVNIYREDGTVLFSDSSLSASFPWTEVTNPVRPLWYPIVKTSTGTKMVLDSINYMTGGVSAYKVYSLPGVYYPTAGFNHSQIDNQIGLSNPYPNPAINSTRIDYELPNGVNVGEIVFYNLMGNEVKRYKVDRAFNTLLISTSDITSGTYYYQLQTSGQSSKGKKMVVIK